MVSRIIAPVVGAAVVGALVVATLWAWPSLSGVHGTSPSTAADEVPVATAVVNRTTLSSTTQLSGTLGHGLATPVFGGGPGSTLTAFALPGTLVSRGQELFEADGQPVDLLYGTRPSWRDLQPGVTPGPDVLQLEQNLVDLGYAAGLGLTVDDHFTWATACAVMNWQHATGQTVTGTIVDGSVVFEPGPVRVEAANEALGALLQSGQPVLTVDSAAVGVVAQVPTSQTYLVHAGDKVSVVLPSGTSIKGKIVSLSTVASPSNPADSGTQQGPEVTLPVIIALDNPAAAQGLDQAPVTVNVTDQTVTNVLAVPITALIALAGGGYGVYIVDGSTRHLVGVKPGLFASTLVQVTSTSLKAGDHVQVPAS